MKKLFIVLISLTSSLLFSQNVDAKKIEQLATAISENGCNCVQQVKNSNGDWVNSIENCFVESFKKNEPKVKQLLGANYLDEENGQNILQIVRNAESYWTSSCLKKLKSEQDFTLNLVYYFNKNVNLTYDLTSLLDEQNFEDGAETEDEVVSEELEYEVVFVKSYQDLEKDTHLVFKDDNNETFDMFILDENNTILPLLNQKQIKANQKVKIIIRQTDFVDEETKETMTALFVVDLQKI